MALFSSSSSNMTKVQVQQLLLLLMPLPLALALALVLLLPSASGVIIKVRTTTASSKSQSSSLSVAARGKVKMDFSQGQTGGNYNKKAQKPTQLQLALEKVIGKINQLKSENSWLKLSFETKQKCEIIKEYNNKGYMNSKYNKNEILEIAQEKLPTEENYNSFENLWKVFSGELELPHENFAIELEIGKLIKRNEEQIQKLKEAKKALEQAVRNKQNTNLTQSTKDEAYKQKNKDQRFDVEELNEFIRKIKQFDSEKTWLEQFTTNQGLLEQKASLVRDCQNLKKNNMMCVNSVEIKKYDNNILIEAMKQLPNKDNYNCFKGLWSRYSDSEQLKFHNKFKSQLDTELIKPKEKQIQKLEELVWAKVIGEVKQLESEKTWLEQFITKEYLKDENMKIVKEAQNNFFEVTQLLQFATKVCVEENKKCHKQKIFNDAQSKLREESSNFFKELWNKFSGEQESYNKFAPIYFGLIKPRKEKIQKLKEAKLALEEEKQEKQKAKAMQNMQNINLTFSTEDSRKKLMKEVQQIQNQNIQACKLKNQNYPKEQIELEFITKYEPSSQRDKKNYTSLEHLLLEKKKSVKATQEKLRQMIKFERESSYRLEEVRFLKWYMENTPQYTQREIRKDNKEWIADNKEWIAKQSLSKTDEVRLINDMTWEPQELIDDQINKELTMRFIGDGNLSHLHSEYYRFYQETREYTEVQCAMLIQQRIDKAEKAQQESIFELIEVDLYLTSLQNSQTQKPQNAHKPKLKLQTFKPVADEIVNQISLPFIEQYDKVKDNYHKLWISYSSNSNSAELLKSILQEQPGLTEKIVETKIKMQIKMIENKMEKNLSVVQSKNEQHQFLTNLLKYHRIVLV